MPASKTLPLIFLNAHISRWRPPRDQLHLIITHCHSQDDLITPSLLNVCKESRESMAVYWYKKFAVENQKGQRDVWWNPAIDIISVPEGLQWEPWKRCVDVCTKQFPLETERDPSSCFGLLLFAVEERVSLPGRAL
ncbi:uncharacterized protein K444DRAFT_608350 [Hyaloscypha bicolor E]|uniref:2EXR domain-containing protein n=1 Tax=Hyaloscypha bicolor E TaxID=1095630 RepID=A0A2J6TNQ3_9HELO|nr:uncharacterized protein K444DRAFT_608350 [Hyaloscypha bicolor E]PMD64647.1 hypothetical protein K444DRAFT_608350 [Hyaloscypha bicolor E]